MANKQYISQAPGWNVISTYFTQTDIQHMLQVSQEGIDLSNSSGASGIRGRRIK